MWGLILGICFVAIAVGLRVDGKVGDTAFIALLCLAVVSGFLIVKIGVTGRLTAGPFELETFHEDVNLIKDEALKEIRKEVVVLKEAVSSVVDKANKTRGELLKVADMASPPLLSLESSEVKQVDEVYEVLLIFKPSKNAPFAALVFSAEIVGNLEATIKDLDAVLATTSRHKEISDDGKTARLQYVPLSTIGLQKLRLKLSAPCKVRIACSHMQKEVEFEVK